MIWKEEIKIIEELSKRVMNLGSDVSRKLANLESRHATLTNELTKLEADYTVIQARNEEAKKSFQNAHRSDFEQLEDGKKRIRERELQLFEKEKEMRKLKADLETELALMKTNKETVEAMGRQHARK